MKIFTMSGVLIIGFAAIAQHREALIRLMPGESVSMIDPTTHQYSQVVCEGRHHEPIQHGSNIEFYYGDSCQTLVAIKKDYQNCDSLSGGSSQVWSIKIGNKCENIEDTNLITACKRLESIERPRATRLYYGDSCQTLVAAVDRTTDCQALPGGSSQVWSMKDTATSDCKNIEDTNLSTACQRFK